MISLEDLQLIEAAIFSVDFNQTKKSTGKGKISLEYGEVGMEAGGVMDNNQKKALIINATPKIIGTAEENGQEIDGFHLKINFRLFYTYDRSFEVSEKFLSDNQWFFASQVRAYFKVFSDNILNNSTINGIKLPL